MPKPVLKSPVELVFKKPIFKNEVLADAVIWGLSQGQTEPAYTQHLMDSQLATRLLTFAVERAFVAGCDSTKGKANILRHAFIHLNETGLLPDALHAFRI